MRLMRRPAIWATALLLTNVLVGSTSGRVAAQVPVPVPIDCGPMGILVGDLVALNVGNGARAPQAPLVVQFRLLDAEGRPLLERSVTLAPGQSRSLSLRAGRTSLVRGEVVPLSSPEDLRLKATMQVLSVSPAGGLTYGPIVECSGPTGNRGPV